MGYSSLMGEPECILDTGLGFYGEITIALSRGNWPELEKGVITELDLTVSVNVVCPALKDRNRVILILVTMLFIGGYSLIRSIYRCPAV